MPPDSIDLDGHRSDKDKKATETRRRHDDVRQGQNRLEQRGQALEWQILARPAESWPEAAARARHLIHLLAEIFAIRNGRQRALIDSVLRDFARLMRDGEAARGMGSGEQARSVKMEFETNGDHRGCHYISRIALSERQGRVHVRTEVAIDLHDDATAAEQLAFRALSPHGSANFVSELEGWGMTRAEAEIQAAKIVRDRIDAIFGPSVTS